MDEEGEVWEGGREVVGRCGVDRVARWRGGGIRRRWCTARPLIVLWMRSSAHAWHSVFLDTGGMMTVFMSRGSGELI